MADDSVRSTLQNPLASIFGSEEQAPAPTLSPEEAILQNPNAPASAKKEVLSSAIANKQVQKNDELVDKMQRIRDFSQAMKDQQELEVIRQQTPDVKIAPSPKVKLEDYGLSTDDLVSMADPALQQKAVQMEAQKVAEAQQAAVVQQQQQQVAEGEAEAQKQRNNMDGFIAKQEKISQDMQSAYQKQIEALDDEQNKLSEVDPNRFWSNLSTGQKILGAISIGLGSIGGALSKTGGNVALDIINKAIDNDISAQKVNNEQKLALKQNALKRAALEVDRLSELSKDQERKFQMKQVSDQLRANEQALMSQRANQKALIERLYSSGLTPEEADSFLDEKQTVRKVSLPDGNITLAVSQNAANTYNQSLKDMVSATQLTDKVAKQVAQYTALDAATPFGSKKAALESDVQALVGALRIPITGPGVLNEQEYQRIMGKVIGDPSALTTVKSVAQAKMKSLQETLKMVERANLEATTGKKWLTNEDRLRKQLLRESTPLEDMETIIQEAKKKNPDFYSK